ncbi:Transposase IS4 [Popillia japonica]|uniref:Transposase IS4 n=1 Tax=Popillia japonica TaxID=7064 RepID=A0AAW1LAT2_POPJA
MGSKKPLTEKELEYHANLSDSEFDEIFGEAGDDSSYYEPSENSSDSDDEVVSDLNKGYTVYMDNFYNSVTLTKLLNTRKTYVCGTLRSNRKGNPRDVVNCKLKKGECIWRQNGPVTVCKWKDKRDVHTISNMHSVEMVEVSNRNGKVSMKPNIIIEFEITTKECLTLTDQIKCCRTTHL